MCADTFGVSVHLTDEELRLVVHVPSEIDSGWTDPEAFQSLVASTVWARLDRRSVLETIVAEHDSGETVTVGTVTLEPDGTVIDHEFAERFVNARESNA